MAITPKNILTDDVLQQARDTLARSSIIPSVDASPTDDISNKQADEEKARKAAEELFRALQVEQALQEEEEAWLEGVLNGTIDPNEGLGTGGVYAKGDYTTGYSRSGGASHDIPSVPSNDASAVLVGTKLDMDMSLLNANANGKAMVLAATGKHGRGVPGEVMIVDVNTGIIEASFSFVSGNGKRPSEAQKYGVAPGLTGELDFDSSEDVQARWGMAEAPTHSGRQWWTDGENRTWHIKTADSMDGRGGLWFHPVRTEQSQTHGCIGLKPSDSADFYNMYVEQGGFPEATFISQDVVERSLNAPALVAEKSNTISGGEEASIDAPSENVPARVVAEAEQGRGASQL